MITPQERPALDESRRGGLRPALGPYLLAGVLCMLSEFVLFSLWDADFRIPFYHPIGSDLLHNMMLSKNLAENGSILTYPRLGAPGFLEHHDYTTLDYLHTYS